MTEYSYDVDDYRFYEELERMYIEAIEELPTPQKITKEWPYADPQSKGGTTSRREGVDESESPPAWWVRKEGMRILRETFSDGDEPQYGSPVESNVEEVTIMTSFMMFPTAIRVNNWF